MGSGELKDVVDISQLQARMDSFHKISSIPVGILDADGNILVAAGWQDVCAKYHRVHPETAANCKISDAYLKSNLRAGEYVEHKCRNSMRELATPIIIKDKHWATLFLGQFFYDDETVDMDFFRRQAATHGFPMESYMDALAKVPVLSRQKVKDIMGYCAQLVQMLITMGLARLELENFQASLQKLADERAQKVMEATASLRESEEKYRQIFQQATDYILVLEPALDGSPKIVDASDSAFEKHGYTREELLGKPITFLDAPSSGVKAAERMKILGSGMPLTFEAEHYRKDGSTFVVEVNAKMIALGGKRLLYTIERDITGRKKAEEARKESEEKYRQLFHGSRAVKILYEPETGKLFDANDAACRFYGYTREELVSKSLYEINTMSPSELKAGIEEAKTKKRDSFIVRHRLASGEVRDVEVFPSPITIGGKTFIHSIVHDITERKKSDRLLGCRAELSALFTTASVDELIQAGLDAAERLTSSRIGFFHFVDDDQENLTLQTWSTNTIANMCKAEGKGMHYPISKAGVWVDCFHQKKPVIHNDYAALPHKKGMPEGHAPVTRELSIPVIHRDKVMAIMGVGNKEADYTREDVEITLEAASILFDLVERKRAEEALRASEKRLAEAQRMAKTGDWTWDLANNTLTWSDETYHLFGLDKATYVPTLEKYADLVHPDDRHIMREVNYLGNIGKKTHEIEYRIIAQDTREVKWLLTKGETTFGADGKPLFVRGTLQDITERKSAEREKEQLMLELSRKATEKDAILASQNNVILSYDLNMNVQQVNPAFVKTYGFDPVGLNVKEIIRRVNCRMMDGSPLNLEEQPTPKALHGEATDSRLYLVTKADGTSGVVDTSSRPLLVGGRIAGSVTVWHDITDLKMKERELRAAKEAAEAATTLKDKFVSLVAHDLNGPLGSMVGCLKQLGRNSFSPEDTAKIYSTAIATGENMLDLINNLLNISRIKLGKLKPDLKFISAYFLAVKAMSEFRYRAEEKGVKLVNEVSRDTRLFADESLFDEVVRNLVSNAVKFTGPGKCVRIFTPPGKPAAIAVSDEGIGIDDARMSHLFEYETRTSTVGTAGELGTGLGLPLSRDIMEAHGGRLTVESVKGKGTVFCAELPLVKPKVLFACDDRLAGIFLERYVSGMGLELKSAANGSEALEMVGAWKPNLVITDVKMPGLDGFKLVDGIRQNPDTAKIPIIMTSAFSDPELSARITNVHVDDFISKPFIAEEVVSKIRRILG